MWVPYCIIKGKAKLGRLVHRKTCTTVTFTQKTQVLWLSWWRLSRPITTNMMRSAPSVNATSYSKLEKAKAKKLTTKLG